MEDYTTYTEQDANGCIDVVSATEVDFTNVGRQGDEYIVDDKGAAYFSGDFSYNVDVKITSFGGATAGPIACFGIASIQQDMSGILINNATGLFVEIYSSTPKLQIREIRGGSQNVTGSTHTFSLNTWEYLTIRRVEADGTYGTLYVDRYTDSARTSLAETLSRALGAKDDLQYLYGLNNYSNGDSLTDKYISGIFKNLLNNDASGFSVDGEIDATASISGTGVPGTVEDGSLSAAASISADYLNESPYDGLIVATASISGSFNVRYSAAEVLTPGPWDFVPQTNKYGYQNNPNWTGSGLRGCGPDIIQGRASDPTRHIPCGHWHKGQILSPVLVPGYYNQQNIIYYNGWYYMIALGVRDGESLKRAVVVRFQDDIIYKVYEPTDYPVQSTVHPIQSNGTYVVFAVINYYDGTTNVYTVDLEGNVLNTISFVNNWGGSFVPHMILRAGNTDKLVCVCDIFGDDAKVFYSDDFGLTWDVFTAVEMAYWMAGTLTPGGIFAGYMTTVWNNSGPIELLGTESADTTETAVTNSYIVPADMCSNSSYIFLLHYYDDLYGTLDRHWVIEKYDHSWNLLDTYQLDEIWGTYGLCIACTETSIVYYAASSENNAYLNRALISDMIFSKVFDIDENFSLQLVPSINYCDDRYIFTACELIQKGTDKLSWVESVDDGETWTIKNVPFNENIGLYVIEPGAYGQQFQQPVWPFKGQSRKTNGRGYWPKS